MRPEPIFCVLAVRVQPRSSRNKIELQDDGTLKIWTTAPPVEGEANLAVCALLAKSLHVPKSNVNVVSGESSREKRVRVEGVAFADALNQLGPAIS